MDILYISSEALWTKVTQYLIVFNKRMLKLKNQPEEVYHGELHLGGHYQEGWILTSTHSLMSKTNVKGLSTKAKS